MNNLVQPKINLHVQEPKIKVVFLTEYEEQHEEITTHATSKTVGVGFQFFLYKSKVRQLVFERYKISSEECKTI